MKLVYSPLAQQDMLDIGEYIRIKLCNVKAAQDVVKNIAQACSLLKEQPMLGMSMQKRTGLPFDIRYFVVGNYLVFYKEEGNVLKIIRVLDSRTDYIRKSM